MEERGTKSLKWDELFILRRINSLKATRIYGNMRLWMINVQSSIVRNICIFLIIIIDICLDESSLKMQSIYWSTCVYTEKAIEERSREKKIKMTCLKKVINSSKQTRSYEKAFHRPSIPNKWQQDVDIDSWFSYFSCFCLDTGLAQKLVVIRDTNWSREVTIV